MIRNPNDKSLSSSSQFSPSLSKLLYQRFLIAITYTAWKVSVFGVFLVRIFPHSDWIRRYGVSFRIQSEWGKIRTRKTPNTDTFHAVLALVSATGTIPARVHKCKFVSSVKNFICQYLWVFCFGWVSLYAKLHSRGIFRTLSNI